MLCQLHAEHVSNVGPGSLEIHEESSLTEHRGGRRPAGKPAVKAPAKAGPLTVQSVESALTTQAPRAVAHVRRIRKANPDMSREEILRRLETKFRLDAARTGRAAGAEASSGAGKAIDSGSGKATLEVAVFFVLAATEAYKVPLSELEYREEMVRAVLLVRKTDWAVRLLAARTAPHLAGKIMARIPASALRPINNVMGPRFMTLYGQSGGIVLADELEREVAGAFGSLTNSAFAWNVIRVTRQTLESSDFAFDVDGDIVDEDMV